MDEKTVHDKLRAFILKDLIRDPKYDLADDEGIITEGMIDSFSLAQIGVFAEQEFNVYIPDPDLTVTKMNTLTQMVSRIMRDIK
jgi:acyl carrier protein